jgi:hypothetical protein
MLIQGQVGQALPASSGSTPAVRVGNLGDMIVSELHGRYYETTYRRNMFVGTSTGQNISVGGNVSAGTTANTAILYNPVSSNVNLVLNKVGINTSVVGTANAIVGLATGFSATGIGSVVSPSTSTGGTAVTRGAVPGQPAGQGVVYASANLVTGSTVSHSLTSINSAVATQGTVVDLEGSLIVPPGGFVSLYATAAQTGSQFAVSYQWEEVPLAI